MSMARALARAADLWLAQVAVGQNAAAMSMLRSANRKTIKPQKFLTQ